MLCCISRNFSRLSTCHGQVAYVLLTRAPVAGGDKQAYLPAAPRLACVKPVASVHPEPGSNSSLLVYCFFLFQEVLFGLTRNLPALKLSFVRFPTRLSPYKYCVVDLGKLTELLALVLLHRYCKSFNVLPSGPNRRAASVSEQPCKATAFFLSGQIFRRKNFQNPEPSGNPACYSPWGHLHPLACGRAPAGVRFVPESGCKITTFLLTHQIFQGLFSGKISQPHRHYERILLLIKILHPIIFFEIKRAHPEICYTSSTGMHRNPPL